MEANPVSAQPLKIGLYSQATALFLGMLLHGSAVVTGRALFFGKIFTPTLDLLFVPFIVLGGVLGCWGHFASVIRPRPLRWAGIAVSAYFVISIPFHARTLLTWSTAHFTAFPEYYSLIIIPVQLLFLLIVVGELRAGREGLGGLTR